MLTDVGRCWTRTFKQTQYRSVSAAWEFSVQCPQGESSKRRPNCACAQPTFLTKVVERRTKCLMKRLNLFQHHPRASVRSYRIECWMKLDYRISSVYNHGWRAQEISLVRIHLLQCWGSILCEPTEVHCYRRVSSNTGSLTSKYKHRRTSTLLHNIRNIRKDLYGKKPYRLRNLRKWKRP